MKPPKKPTRRTTRQTRKRPLSSTHNRDPEPTEKLQKVLAARGVASRRMAERYIELGQVKVNGKPASLGMRVSNTDVIHFRGKRLSSPRSRHAKTRVLLYHKPEGEVCTARDPERRKTVFDGLPRCAGGRWIQVGRLDLNTAGVLLFTNNGQLANQLMHPSSQIEREYAVRVFGEVDANMLRRLTDGVMLEDGKAAFKDIADAGGQGRNHWYHVVLTEGRNREVRRLWEAVGVKVSRLIRVRFGSVTLPRSLRQGKWRDLTAEEISVLRASLGADSASQE